MTQTIVTILAEEFSEFDAVEGSRDVRFRCQDDGDGYTRISVEDRTVLGTIHFASILDPVRVEDVGKPADRLRVIIRRTPAARAAEGDIDPAPRPWLARAFVRSGMAWLEVEVQVVPVRQELFSRTRGIYETDKLADRSVFVAGLGSGGAPIVLELVKAGVGNLLLMDHDRLSVANIARHPLGLSDVGRFKTKALAERILDKNPFARVETWEEKVCRDTQNLVRECVRRSDLVVCAIDDEKGRLLLNKACVDAGKVMLLGACYRRAYGGAVIRVRPQEGICYQCFRMAMPEAARDREISSQEQADRVAYSDLPVVPEPGLATDIAPISLMVTKLAIQELLKGKATALRSLDEDLQGDWLLWLNRIEPGTGYEQLDPMGSRVDRMTILRWYSIAMERNPACPHCGDFLGVTAQEEGLDIDEADVAAFAEGGGE